MIDKFQRKESLAFLTKILEGEKEEDLHLLAEALGDFPLALAQAAGYIKMNPSIHVKTYLVLLKENHSELWKSEERFVETASMGEFLNDNYNKTMFTTIKMNIEGIKKHSPLAYEMLCFCSLLHHHHIPLNMLEKWACDKRGSTKIEFHEALSTLLNYFLLEKEAATYSKEAQALFNQHELIQVITVDTIKKDTKIKILKEGAECIVQELSYLPTTLLEQFKDKEYLYNHIEKLCNLANEFNYNDRSIIELNISLLYYVHFFLRDFHRSGNLIKSLKNKKDRNLNSLAEIWFYCTDVNDKMFENLSEVQKSYKKTLEVLERIKDQETKKSYLLHVSLDYAESLSNFGKIKEAISICDTLEDILKTAKNESQKPNYFTTLALIRLRYGQYDQSLKELDSYFKAISDGSNAQSLPFAQLIKAHCLLYQGKVHEAYHLIEKCYPQLLEIAGTLECAMLVNTQLIKGACLAAFGNLEEALQVIQQSLGPYEKSTGFENDVLKGMGYRLLGEIYEVKGDFEKACEEYLKAEKIYDKILQEKSLDDLSLLYTRLALLGAKQRDDTMVKKYLSLHINDFGLSHPRTFKIKQYLDSQGFSLP